MPNGRAVTTLSSSARVRPAMRRPERRRTLAVTSRWSTSGPLGGLCILRGCMPSKALLASSDALQDAREARALGIAARGLTYDMPFIARAQARARSRFRRLSNRGYRRVPALSGRRAVSLADALAVGDDTILEAPEVRHRDGQRRYAEPSLPGLASTGFVDSDARARAGSASRSRSSCSAAAIPPASSASFLHAWARGRRFLFAAVIC